jgi:hypothetical protein
MATLYKRIGLGIPIGQTVWPMLSATECRSNSKECERLAREALSPLIRTAWANMARTWIVLAKQTDHIENLLREHRTHIP